jgi:predicted TIM-barrel fold metal-dependent hydrolase
VSTHIRVSEELLKQRLLDALKNIAKEVENDPDRFKGMLQIDIQTWVAKEVAERTIKPFRP